MKSHFNPFPEWALTDVMMKSVGSRNFPSSSHRGAGWGPLCTMQFKVPLCTMHYTGSFPICMPSHHFSINTSCSIRKVRMSYKESVGMVLVRGWVRLVSGINHVEYKILDRWSRKKAGARLQCDRGFAQAVDAHQSVPVTWVFTYFVNMQICSLVLLECS